MGIATSIRPMSSSTARRGCHCRRRHHDGGKRNLPNHDDPIHRRCPRDIRRTPSSTSSHCFPAWMCSSCAGIGVGVCLIMMVVVDAQGFCSTGIDTGNSINSTSIKYPYQDWRFPKTLSEDDDAPQALSCTVSGYDVGGTDSICWASVFCDPILLEAGSSSSSGDIDKGVHEYDSSSVSDYDTSFHNLVLLNQHLVETPQRINHFTMLPSCPLNTKLSIEVVSGIDEFDGDVDKRTIWHNRTTTYRVTASIDKSDFFTGISMTDAGRRSDGDNDDTDQLRDEESVGQDDDVVVIWYRIVKCSADKVGFCQPFLDSNRWRNSNNHSGDAQDVKFLSSNEFTISQYNHSNGDVLQLQPMTKTSAKTSMVGSDMDENVNDDNDDFVYVTSWISQRLRRQNAHYEDDHDDGSASATNNNTDFLTSPSEEGLASSTTVYTNVQDITVITQQHNFDNAPFHIIVHATIQLVSPSSSNDGVDDGSSGFVVPNNLTTNDNATTTKTYRIDVANVLPGGPVDVRSWPHVSYVSNGIVVFTGVLIGICGSVNLVMTVFLVKNRNHQVLTMAQGGLLAWLAASACATIALSFLFLPIYDIFCRLRPLLFIPGTFIPSILVGRLWRVYSTLNGAHRLGKIGKSIARPSTHTFNDNIRSESVRNESERVAAGITTAEDGSRSIPTSSTVGGGDRTIVVDSRNVHRLERWARYSQRTEENVMKVLSLLSFSWIISRWLRAPKDNRGRYRRRTTSALRRTTTTTETVVLICVLALPQVAVQTFGAAHFDSYLYIDWDEDGNEGRYTCWELTHSWLFYVGAGYLALLFLLAMYVAWCSRHLPSAFNEKNEIFTTGFINGIATCVFAGGIAVADTSEVSPNLTSVLSILFTILISVVTSWTVVIPKIRRARSGEKVVLSNVLRHINQVSSSSESDFDDRRLVTQQWQINEDLTPPNEIGANKARKRIVVQADEGLPSKIEQKLYAMKHLTIAVTDRCAEGRPLDEDEWDSLLQTIAELASDLESLSMNFSAGDRADGDKSIDYDKTAANGNGERRILESVPEGEQDETGDT